MCITLIILYLLQVACCLHIIDHKMRDENCRCYKCRGIKWDTWPFEDEWMTPPPEEEPLNPVVVPDEHNFSDFFGAPTSNTIEDVAQYVALRIQQGLAKVE